MFGFNIRNPERDHQTDLARFGRIRSTLTAVRNELQLEKLGLTKRFAEASADAALTFEAMTDGSDRNSCENRLEKLTTVIKAYEQRINFLDSQIEFVDSVLEKVTSFCKKP